MKRGIYHRRVDFSEEEGNINILLWCIESTELTPLRNHGNYHISLENHWRRWTKVQSLKKWENLTRTSWLTSHHHLQLQWTQHNWLSNLLFVVWLVSGRLLAWLFETEPGCVFWPALTSLWSPGRPSTYYVVHGSLTLVVILLRGFLSAWIRGTSQHPGLFLLSVINACVFY